MSYNKISAVFGAMTRITLPPVNYKFDEKQILVISGIELPEYYTVDFCNEGDEQTIPMVGTANGVQIPDDFFLTGKAIKGYVVVTDEDESVQTRYEITIPVRFRPERTDIEPTPAERQVIDGLIDQMNEVTGRAEAAAENAETSEQNASDSATLAESWAVGGTGTRENEDNDNAKHYAELAAQGAEESGYAWFDVNDEDGHMYIYISDNLSEDVDFAINEETGHLMITYN